jgi:hypothetical protein
MQADQLVGALMAQMGQSMLSRAAQLQTPAPVVDDTAAAAAAAPPEPKKAAAIGAIIKTAYEMKDVPERTRKRIARYQIEEEFGAEEAKKYLRSNKKKIPVPVPVVETPAPAVTAPAVVAPVPVALPAVNSVTEAPTISVDKDLRSLIKPATQPEVTQ